VKQAKETRSVKSLLRNERKNKMEDFIANIVAYIIMFGGMALLMYVVARMLGSLFDD